MENEITAKWARETAENILSEKASKQLETCLSNIKHGVNRNEFDTTLYFSPETRVIEELRKRGFDIEINEQYHQMDGPSFRISW